MNYIRIFCIFFLVQCLNVYSFTTLINHSLSIIKYHSNIYKIDDSHNHIHSKEVLYYTNEILKNEYVSLTKDEIYIVVLASLFHDVIDSKYVSESNIQKKNLLMNYLSELLVPDYIFNEIWFIINNMSYSKTIKYDKYLEPYYEIPKYMESYKYKKLFDIVRNADLLSSYNLKRSFEFNYYKKNDKKEDFDMIDIYNEVLSLYHRRMKKLRKNKILSLDNKKIDEISSYLEKESLEKLESYHFVSYDDTLKFFNMYPKNINIQEINKDLQNKMF